MTTGQASRKLGTFPYAGGKFRKLDWLLPILNIETDTFVDVFGGSAVVSLNRRHLSKLRVYNDKNYRIINFFRCLREEETSQQLIELLRLTPYSNNEWQLGDEIEDDPDPDSPPQIEYARRFFTRIAQGFSGSQGSWGYSVKSADFQATSSWFRKVDRLQEIVEELRHLEIHNRDAIDLINIFKDEESVLYYCDPPYMPETWDTKDERVYMGNNMSTEEHENMLHALLDVRGRVAISGYYSDLYNSMLKGWRRYEYEVSSTIMGSARKGGYVFDTKRLECCWVNYDPQGWLLRDGPPATYQHDLFRGLAQA